MKFLSALLALVAAGSAVAFAPAPIVTRSTVSVQMAASEEFYIDDERRFLMNLLMVGAGAVTVGGFGIPYILFFVPPVRTNRSSHQSKAFCVCGNWDCVPIRNAHELYKPYGDPSCCLLPFLGCVSKLVLIDGTVSHQ
jgi:hypothetical protein